MRKFGEKSGVTRSQSPLDFLQEGKHGATFKVASDPQPLPLDANHGVDSSLLTLLERWRIAFLILFFW